MIGIELASEKYFWGVFVYKSGKKGCLSGGPFLFMESDLTRTFGCAITKLLCMYSSEYSGK
jgi:hypothetical protein